MFEGRGADEYRIHTVQHHIAPNSTSNLLIKGVFNDHSKFHYTGLVKIDKGAQQSHAYQKNQNLLMSPGAYVQSEPFLEILANEVFCTHGSTTGKINEEELTYLASRGVEREKAKELIIEGFFHEVSSRFPNLE
jgi:Fe-S cluster assembly protein SufD